MITNEEYIIKLLNRIERKLNTLMRSRLGDVTVPRESVLAPHDATALETITHLTCNHYQIAPASLLGQGRHEPLVFYRQSFLLLAKEFTDASDEAIGAYCGGRKHSTISWNRRVGKDRFEHNIREGKSHSELREKVMRALVSPDDSKWKCTTASMGHSPATRRGLKRIYGQSFDLCPECRQRHKRARAPRCGCCAAKRKWVQRMRLTTETVRN